MIVTFVCPSSPEPTGGVIVLYELANGLARRGHDVHLIHLPMWGRSIEGIDDLARYSFEPQLTHYIPGEGRVPPPGDIVFGTGAPEGLGLPVLLVQGFDMLHPGLERSAFRTPCLKVCVASWLIDVGERFGVPREQCAVVPNGIDHGHFQLVTPLDQRPFHVAMLHHTHQAKGWPVGLEALRLAHRERPELRAAVFGTTEPREPLPAWATFHKSPDRPTLAREILNRSRIFAQASNYEGFGLPAVEAMACGCALVTTDNGGSRDYAIPGETALVSAPGDAAALARNVVALIDHDEERVRLADAGRRFVARFDWDLAAEQLEGHLRRYLADPAAYQDPPGPELDLDLDEGGWGLRALGLSGQP